MGIDRKAMYAQVAEGIISLMDAGVAPWSRPWLVRGNRDPFAPRNGFYDRPYNGFNSLYLSAVMAKEGWSDPRFFTYNNAKKLGAQVREGEESTLVVYNKRVTKKDDDSDSVSSFFMMKYYRVFNAAQIDGLGVYEPVVDGVEPYWHGDESFPEAERVVNAYSDDQRVFVDYGGDRAFYSPVSDRIGMPNEDQFVSLGAFYHTLFHEIVHSTGHESRQNRLVRNGFGSGDYAKEELVAEFGAAFLAVNCGVPLRDDEAASYLAGWSKRCKDDPGMLVTAVNAAQRAADFVLESASVVEVV